MSMSPLGSNLEELCLLGIDFNIRYRVQVWANWDNMATTMYLKTKGLRVVDDEQEQARTGMADTPLHGRSPPGVAAAKESASASHGFGSVGKSERDKTGMYIAVSALVFAQSQLPMRG